MRTDTMLAWLTVAFALVAGCANGTRPSDPWQKSGAFILRTPVVSDTTYEGYNILSQYPTNNRTFYDVRIFDYAYMDSLNIMANWDSGGIQPGTGDLAPDYAYPRIQRINYPEQQIYPLQFFLLCRDNQHYCLLYMDSIAITDEYSTITMKTEKVCNGYFSYTLNLEEHERQF
jgi:hypothetical protein